MSKALTYRIKASLYHFSISLLIFSVFIAVLLIFWYPEPFFTASGGWQGLKIVAFVDLVLGPLLTFTAFNHLKPKKTLRNDMFIIIILQLSALVWGVNTVYLQRPVAIVFWENNFYTVSYQEIASTYDGSDELKKILEDTRSFYFVPKPITVEGIIRLNNEVEEKQLPPFQLIKRYKTLANNLNEVSNHSININGIIEKNSIMKDSLDELLKNTNATLENNIYFPLISRYQNIILVFSDNHKLLGFIKAPLKTNSQ